MPASIKRRFEILQTANASADCRAIVMAHCRHSVVDWFNDWVWTFDPRAAASGGGVAYMPFDLWPRQADYLRWLDDRVRLREEFVVEKSRDVGATYLTAGFALHKWLFEPGFKTTFGSRVERDVDRIGNPDTIFQKMRIIRDRLPPWMLPAGFNPTLHDLYMRLINPENENIVSGEGGDNMGRGGRATLYIVDEAAHIERAERVEAAITAVAECRGYISSVNGMGNMFARKRHSGTVPVFTFHWRDDPRKDDAWAASKKATTDPVTWAQEYDIDYSASVEGICVPAAWVKAAQQLARLLDIKPSTAGVAGLDIGAGKAKSVWVGRRGAVILPPAAWSDPDTIETAHRGLDATRGAGLTTLNYDAPGVGAGVTAALRRANIAGLRVVPVNTGVPPTSTRWPDGRTSEEMFGNLKAEIWWLMRGAFQRAAERLAWEMGEDGGVEHPLSDVAVVTGEGPDVQALLTQVSLPRWFRNERGKIVLETKAELARRGVASPDYADALALTFVPPRRAVQVVDLGVL